MRGDCGFRDEWAVEEGLAAGGVGSGVPWVFEVEHREACGDDFHGGRGEEQTGLD